MEALNFTDFTSPKFVVANMLQTPARTRPAADIRICPSNSSLLMRKLKTKRIKAAIIATTENIRQ